jgi:putative peptidoglycan lipid II flippase
MNPAAPARRRGVLHSAGVVSAAVLLSRITGVIRETLLAGLFGAGQGIAFDAFVTAFRIPNLLRNLFAEGAFSSAFVPAFTENLTNRSRRDTADLSNAVGTLLILVVGTVSLVGILFAPQLVRLLVPGYALIPGKLELTVVLMRIMFPFLVLVALAAQAMGVLNACDSYGVPALASMWFNIGSVVFGLLLGYTVGRGWGWDLVECMAVGVVIGGALQLLWQVPSLYRAGFALRPSFHFSHPGVRRISRLMVPALVGNAAVQINLLVNTNLASEIRDAAGHVINGPVSWLNCAFRFMQLPLGLFGVAIATATLPAISRSAAGGRLDEFRATLSRSLGMVLLLTIPSSVGLAVLSDSIVGAIYEWHKFLPSDTHQTAIALAWYSLGLAGYSAAKVLAPAFYALDDARTPMVVSLASVVLNFAAAYGLIYGAGWGHAALALSTSVVALGGSVALFVLLRARMHGLHGRALAGSALRTLAASAAMGAAAKLSSAAVHSLVHAHKLAQWTDVLVSIPLALAVFYGAARWLRIPELEAVEAACYTAFRNAPRPEVGDSPARDR